MRKKWMWKTLPLRVRHCTHRWIRRAVTAKSEGQWGRETQWGRKRFWDYSSCCDLIIIPVLRRILPQQPLFWITSCFSLLHKWSLNSSSDSGINLAHDSLKLKPRVLPCPPDQRMRSSMHFAAVLMFEMVCLNSPELRTSQSYIIIDNSIQVL